MHVGETTRLSLYQTLNVKVVFALVVTFVVTISPFFYLQYTRHRATLVAQRIEFATYQSNIVRGYGESLCGYDPSRDRAGERVAGAHG